MGDRWGGGNTLLKARTRRHYGVTVLRKFGKGTKGPTVPLRVSEEPRHDTQRIFRQP